VSNRRGVLGHLIRDVAIVVERERRQIAVTLRAVTADSRVQHGDAGERGVVGGGSRVASAARLVARIWHVAGRHDVGRPVGGVVTSRTVARELLPGGVIGRTQLQGGRRGSHVQGACARVVAGIATLGHEGVLGGAHARRTEAARHVVGRVTGTAVGARQVGNMGRREDSVLRVVVIVEERQLCRSTVALLAIVGDARVQYGNARQCGVAGKRAVDRDVAHRAGLIARIRHVADRQRAAQPVGGVVADRAVTRFLLLVAAAEVVCGPRLQCWRGRAQVEGRARLMTRDARGRHERVLGGAHVRRPKGTGCVSGR